MTGPLLLAAALLSAGPARAASCAVADARAFYAACTGAAPKGDPAKCETDYAEISTACLEEEYATLGALREARTREEFEAAAGRLREFGRKSREINAGDPQASLLTRHTPRDISEEIERSRDAFAEREETREKEPADGRKPGGGRGTAGSERAKREQLERLRASEERAAEGGFGDPGHDAALAKGFLSAGSPADAERAASRAVERAPNSAEALSMRAAARAQLGNNKPAAEDARAALALDPGNEQARTILALTASRVGAGPRLSAPALGGEGEGGASPGGRPGAPGGAALAAAPGAPGAPAPGPGGPALTLVSAADAHIKLAEMKRRVGDLSGALLEASKAILADKANPRAWTLRAAVLNRLKSPGAALKDAEEALRLAPGDPDALVQRAVARHDLGDLAGALEDLERALQRDPAHAMARLYRAMTLEKLGRKAEAIADYEAAARLDPSLRPLAEEGLARLSPGRPAARASVPPSGRGLGPPAGAALAVLLLALGAWRLAARRAPPSEEEDPGRTRLETPREASAPSALIAGQYRVEGELGRGGMGVVYRAFDETLKRAVAVKGLGLEASSSPELRERFLREARLAAKLRHPNLAEIFAAVEEGGELYLVFELIDGVTLQELLSRRGSLPWAEALGLLGQVGAGLDYAHAQRVIHRDLKPANVMLGSDGRAKIMDFGIAHEARALSGSTQTAAWGTPPYMAPEQVLGRVSRESDLYALGVTAFELLTGRRPFDGPAMHDLKLKGSVPAVAAVKAGLPPGLDAFFARALSPEPARRFSSAAELLAALEAARG